MNPPYSAKEQEEMDVKGISPGKWFTSLTEAMKFAESEASKRGIPFGAVHNGYGSYLVSPASPFPVMRPVRGYFTDDDNSRI